MDLLEGLKGLIASYQERQEFWERLGNDDKRLVYARVVGDLSTLIEEAENQ